MKKIVALVLAMVMVLGLATTAFAATTSTGSVVKTSVTVKNAAMYTLGTGAAGMSKDAATVTDIEKTTVTGKVVDDVAMYVPNVYNVDGVLYIEVAKASATKALKNDGAYVYLFPSAVQTDVEDVIDEYATDVVIASFVPGVEVPSCGDEKNSKPYYVTTDGDLYYVGGAAFAYTNGQFVGYNATGDVAANLVPHTFKASGVTYRAVDSLGHKVPVAVECAECEKTFAVVGVADYDNTWELNVNYVVYNSTNVVGAEDLPVTAPRYIVLKAATVSAPAVDGDKVESPKTFDAGIAMYVGMSVMAAAGSAVVLKKKD